MKFNLWTLLHDETTPLCVAIYLKRAREFFCRPFELGKPVIMGHIKWPLAATLLTSEGKKIETLCDRQGLSFADVPDWPVRHDRKGYAALVVWTDEEIKDVTHIILGQYHSDGNLLHKTLVKVDNVKVASKEQLHQVLLFEAEEIYHKESTYSQQWMTTSFNYGVGSGANTAS
jgi:hypothetical protein